MVGVRTFTPFLHVLKIPGRPIQVDFNPRHLRRSPLILIADRTPKFAAGLVTLLTGLGLRWLAATTLSFVVDKEMHILAGGARAIGRGH